MPSGLEARLQHLLAHLPFAAKGVEDHALAMALAALPDAEPRRRRQVRTLLLAAAAAACLLAVSAGALAAAGAIHVTLGGSDVVTPGRQGAVPRLVVPRGAHGIAAVVDGRLWLTTRAGLRIEDLPVDSAALSPHALYVAAGIGDSLVVMAPNGTRAWSHPAGGRVVAIAWAPNGLRIAYVVQRRAGGAQLRTIEGDGDHDHVLDDAVRPVAPTWRADALALAYVGAGGRAVVYDLVQSAHRLVQNDPNRTATRISFAPRGRRLAVASERRLWISGVGRVPALDDAPARSSIAGIAWAGGTIAVALNTPPSAGIVLSGVRVFRIEHDGEPVLARSLVVRAHVTALDAVGAQLVLAAQPEHTRRLLVASVGGSQRLTNLRQVLLEVAAGTTVSMLTVR
jgi:hypothetical protein